MSEWIETDIGLIPRDWQYVPFESVLLQPLRNGVYKSSEYHGQGIRIVNMGEIFKFDKLPSIEMSRIELSDNELEKSSVVEGDLLFARRSLVAEGAGKCTLVLSQEEPLTFESSIIRARPNSKKVDSAYLLYFFSSPIGKYLLKTILRQVAVSGITGADLAKLNLPLPSLEEQKKVSHLLSCLDRKIENLCNQNETLERIAQTLFKQWFVDFEFPNEDGKPYKSSGGIMEQSELGEVPTSWRVHKLRNVVEKANTGADAIQKAPIVEKNTGIRCLRVGDLTNNRLFEDWAYCEVTQKNFEQYRLRKNDILVTRTSALGLNLLITNDLPAVFNNGLIRIKLHENISHFLIFCFLQSKRFKEHIGKITYETSTRPNMQIKYLLDFLILEVDKDIEKEFSALVSKTLSKIDSNKRQIQTLTKTRNVLLPQLMSGKLRIAE